MLTLARSHDESDARDAFIIIHGVKRNADLYWKILNNAFAKGRDANFPGADEDSIRVAPLFFSAERDADVVNSTTLGWAEPNAWIGGDGSTNPPNSDVSVFTVLDGLMQRFADQEAYPKLERLTFVAHGGGAQVLQRYAVLGQDPPSESSLKVRYVIGDPSTMLYFTRDRPVPVDTSDQGCPAFNDFRYGLDAYSAPYAITPPLAPGNLFQRYMSRDVRYLIGSNDTRTDQGDQLCGGHAAGGTARRDRSYNYWSYLHLLAGKTPVPDYPGWYPSLDAGKKGPSPDVIKDIASKVGDSKKSTGDDDEDGSKGEKSKKRKKTSHHQNKDDDDEGKGIKNASPRVGKKTSKQESKKIHAAAAKHHQKHNNSKNHTSHKGKQAHKDKDSKSRKSKANHHNDSNGKRDEDEDVDDVGDDLDLLDEDFNGVHIVDGEELQKDGEESHLSARSDDEADASKYPASDPVDRAGMTGSPFNHRLWHVAGAGHSASEVLGSPEGQEAMFGN